jgi:hypothetical protein
MWPSFEGAIAMCGLWVRNVADRLSPKESMQAVAYDQGRRSPTFALGACNMNTNANDLILAIDLGKYKSVVCTYRTPEDHQFTKLTTSADELTKLVRRVQPTVVLVEACLLSGWSELGRFA